MRKVDRLIREVKTHATKRGHIMSDFQHLDRGGGIGKCLTCGLHAVTFASPLSDEQQFMGAALLFECRK